MHIVHTFSTVKADIMFICAVCVYTVKYMFICAVYVYTVKYMFWLDFIIAISILYVRWLGYFTKAITLMVIRCLYN